MANIKFSQFTEKTTLGTVDFLVGYTGAENVQISPTNLLSTFASGSGTTGFIPKWTSSSNLGDSILEVNSALPDDVLMPRYIRHSGDTNTSFGFPSNDTFVVSTSGSEVIRVTSAGNVGIGTSSPASKLDVIGGVTAQGTLIATGISQLGSGGANVYLTSSSAGNVGIGTSSPTQKLHVDGNQYINGDLDIKSPGVGNSITVLQSTSGNAVVNIGESAVGHGFLSLFEVAVGDVIKFDANANSFINRGNFGIGTTSPSDKLTVNGNLSIFGNKIYNGSGANSAGVSFPSSTTRIDGFNGITFNSSATTVGSQSERMRIDSSGNVGIGTSSPGSKLQVNGTSTFLGSGAASLKWGNASQIGTLTFDPNSDPVIRAESGKSLKFDTNGANNALTLDTSQNATFAGSATIRKSDLGGSTAMADGTLVLGAGTTDYFSFRLDSGADLYFDKVYGGVAANVFSIDRSTTNGDITFAGNVDVNGNLVVEDEIHLTDGGSTVRGKLLLNSSDRDNVELRAESLGSTMKFFTVGTEALELDASQNATFAGQVLCNTNTTSPAGGEAVFYKSSAGAVLSGFQAILETGSAGSRATALVLDSNQNLLVGKTASDFTVVGAELRANGQCVFTADGDNSLDLNRLTNNGAVSVFRQAGTVVGTISVTGSATAYNTSSDYRLKEDLQDFAGLDMISKIAVYDFKWKESEIRSYGVIAHELQEVLSEAVNGEKDAEQMQGVDYSKIVPLLIKSIQELKSEIEELKSK